MHTPARVHLGVGALRIKKIGKPNSRVNPVPPRRAHSSRCARRDSGTGTASMLQRRSPLWSGRMDRLSRYLWFDAKDGKINEIYCHAALSKVGLQQGVETGASDPT